MRCKLISGLFAALFSIAASAFAFAADMAVKAPPPPPPPPAPVYSWTGWYAGVNAGASFGNVKTDFNAAPVTATFLVLNGPPFTFTTPGFGGSDTLHPSGFMGGGQVGYNWQYSAIWVVGLEADIQGADEKASTVLTSNFSGIAPPIDFPVTGSTVLDYRTKIDWFGTVRGRIGYLFGDGAVMTYVTGGLAYGKVALGGTSTVNGVLSAVGGAIPVPFSITHAIGHSNVNTGWTFGGGLEGRLAPWLPPNWTWKLEYLYVDLGSLDDTDVIVPVVGSVTGGQVTTHTHFTDNIVRVGLNYQFH